MILVRTGQRSVTNSTLINIMMAGMANEHILPRAMGRVLPRRRTPVVGIVFVSLLAIGLVSTGEIAGLGDTTAFLLLCVFTVVNIAVLVLHRERVEHQHFRTRAWCCRDVISKGRPCRRSLARA
ncbi:hypothetical protein GCM10010425_65140 [Streptomyces spororaveus]|uniref:Amino acid permease n=1 Tax=Streptomyces spororaveus TaxID=284039 RepID=A0ABQ3T6L8_9ACTN|nr:hypothetical protein Sspor_16000 [Streptomyces spororaveus]